MGGRGGSTIIQHSIGKSDTNLRQAYLPRQRENPQVIFLRQVDFARCKFVIRCRVCANAIKVKPNQINEGNQMASICFDCNRPRHSSYQASLKGRLSRASLFPLPVRAATFSRGFLIEIVAPNRLQGLCSLQFLLVLVFRHRDNLLFTEVF